MVYRLSYVDTAGVKHVQYGADAIYHRPNFMPLEHAYAYTFGGNVTIHPQLDTAQEGVRRYNADTGENLKIDIEFSKTKKGPWSKVVSTEVVESHLNSLVSI